MANVEFTDFSVRVSEAIDDAVIAFLHEASAEIVTETQNNVPVDTGQLKGSWTYQVDESAQEARIGSPLENAIWNEFGTGIYAANGDGRKTPWVYKDAKGVTHFTRGKKAQHSFQKAFTAKKGVIIRGAETILKNRLR